MKNLKIIIPLVILISLGGLALSYGYWTAYKKKKPQANPTSETVSTLNWREYVNAKYGWRIKYPNRWQTESNQSKSEVRIFLPTNQSSDTTVEQTFSEGMVISTKDNPDSLSSVDWILANINASDFKRADMSDVKVNNIAGTKIDKYQDSSYAIFLAREKRIFIFTVYEKDKKAVVETALTQFEFVNQLSELDKIYVIKSGETLSYIATKFKIDWLKLARYNKIRSPYNVVVGEKIRIPADPNAISISSGTSIDLEIARQLQARVDAGKEVWRLDPLEVAKRDIPPQKGITGEDDFRLAAEDRLAGQVTIEITRRDGIVISAELVQPIRKGSGGIWQVKSLQIK